MASSAESRQTYEAALALAVALGDRAAEARLRNSLGIIAWNRGDFDGALHDYRQALDIFRALEDAAGTGLMLNSIGVTLIKQHRFDEAAHTLGEALAVHRSVRNTLFEAHAETALGEICEARGALASARRHYRTALELRERAGDMSGTGWMLHRIARLAALTGAMREVEELTARARRIAADCGDTELQDACQRIVVHQ